jgi:hypothetical protein
MHIDNSYADWYHAKYGVYLDRPFVCQSSVESKDIRNKVAFGKTTLTRSYLILNKGLCMQHMTVLFMFPCNVLTRSCCFAKLTISPLLVWMNRSHKLYIVPWVVGFNCRMKHQHRSSTLGYNRNSTALILSSPPPRLPFLAIATYRGC